MDAFFDRLISRAATIDELLSHAFEPLPGQKGDADLAARRLAAWCKSCASGDWSLFGQRLDRDGLTFSAVLQKFATVRRALDASIPEWIADAVWIDAALQDPDADYPNILPVREPVAFQELLTPLVSQSNSRLDSKLESRPIADLAESARADLSYELLKNISDIVAGSLYERFDSFRKDAAVVEIISAQCHENNSYRYKEFCSKMRSGGFRRLFEEKPVLLRLVSIVTRQWLDTTYVFIDRLSADIALIHDMFFRNSNVRQITGIEGDLSDPHNGGYSVKLVIFNDGARVIYKPKDLRVDVAWYELIIQLNLQHPPVELRAARTLAREGYGWAEFIEHVGCQDESGPHHYFRRAGALLSLFHLFAANDMHEENLIARGEYPIPIDLEMLLQTSVACHKTEGQHAEAFETALRVIENSVMMVGLLPTFGRAADHSIFVMGGLISNWNSNIKLVWSELNSDAMVPRERSVDYLPDSNLPHVAGHYSQFSENVEELISGFDDYCKFLIFRNKESSGGLTLDDFADLPIRKITRPTAFYQMLLHRLKDHRNMDDGAVWSAQADFVARLADWENGEDNWPLQSAERTALLALNIPYFQTLTDNCDIRSIGKCLIQSEGISGLSLARQRINSFGQSEKDWQIEVIRQNTATLKAAESAPVLNGMHAIPNLLAGANPNSDIFIEEANKIASDIERHAIQIGASATWIGLDWMGASDVAQLLPLGDDLYDGLAGVSLFLAAYFKITGSKRAEELAMAALQRCRKRLKGRNAARIARSLGLGGATGLGSIVYGLSVISNLMNDRSLMLDAILVSELFSDDLIQADRQFDIVSGAAGGILGLLRLYRDTSCSGVLVRAVKCGDYLLQQQRSGKGRRVWLGQGNGDIALNGMSHGAAGFAYALSSLAAMSGRKDFAEAAIECIEYENRSFDSANSNWPDLRANAVSNYSQSWSHGAGGIGIARAAMIRKSDLDPFFLRTEVEKALGGINRTAVGASDTLCSGSLGVVEFLREASIALDRDELSSAATRLMASVVEGAKMRGDYIWSAGKRQYNIGLFRGLSGLGYTLLRELDPSLPNILTWE